MKQKEPDEHAMPHELHFMPLGAWIPQNRKHKIRRTLSKNVVLVGPCDGVPSRRTIYNLELDRQNYWSFAFGVN